MGRVFVICVPGTSGKACRHRLLNVLSVLSVLHAFDLLIVLNIEAVGVEPIAPIERAEYKRIQPIDCVGY